MRMNLLIVTFLLACLFTAGCAPRPYHAPANGAETQFDKGLPPEKHTRHLYSKKERAEMARMGYPVD
ncbi:MAG TPA: hypothetical protein VGC22_03360 [Chitinophaga sp.]